MSRKKLTDFEFVWKSYGRFKEGPPNLGLMRALLLRNTHTGMQSFPYLPNLIAGKHRVCEMKKEGCDAGVTSGMQPIYGGLRGGKTNTRRLRGQID